MKKLFVKQKNGRKIGVLIAMKDVEGKVVVGFSQCCKNDSFDKSFGEEIAARRAFAYSDRDCVDNIPFKVAAALPGFLDNCKRYFKDCEMPRWTNGFTC